MLSRLLSSRLLVTIGWYPGNIMTTYYHIAYPYMSIPPADMVQSDGGHIVMLNRMLQGLTANADHDHSHISDHRNEIGLVNVIRYYLRTIIK